MRVFLLFLPHNQQVSLICFPAITFTLLIQGEISFLYLNDIAQIYLLDTTRCFFFSVGPLNDFGAFHVLSLAWLLHVHVKIIPLGTSWIQTNTVNDCSGKTVRFYQTEPVNSFVPWTLIFMMRFFSWLVLTCKEISSEIPPGITYKQDSNAFLGFDFVHTLRTISSVQ